MISILASGTLVSAPIERTSKAEKSPLLILGAGEQLVKMKQDGREIEVPAEMVTIHQEVGWTIANNERVPEVHGPSAIERLKVANRKATN